MSELLLALLRVNLALAAAIGLILILRRPVRARFGARIAYGLWALAPLAAAAALAPARIVTLTQPVTAPPPAVQAMIGRPIDPAAAPALRFDPTLPLGALWVAGGLLSLAGLARRQARFGRDLRAGLAGPAVIGVLRPRIVLPADFARRYTARERQVVLAHEETHLARQDSRVNGLAALAACVNWFNPLAHLAVRCLRIDQEYACDAQVIAAHPSARRSYAEAMLKTQLAMRPLPLGCYWPGEAVHPLAERIRLLSFEAPTRAGRRLGWLTVGLVGLAGAGAVWAARPAEVVWIAAPDAAPSPRAESLPAVAPAVQRIAPTAAAPRPAQPVPSAVAAESAGPVGLAPETAQPEPAVAINEVAAPWPPPRAGKVFGVAQRSSVQPGSAVRVLATMTDADGVPLVTDLTAFGSQSRFRTGYVQHRGSRYSLFTSVVQVGERLQVSASLDRRFQGPATGSIELASGETGRIVLGDGQVVTVTPWLRPETAEERAAALEVRREPFGRELAGLW